MPPDRLYLLASLHPTPDDALDAHLKRLEDALAPLAALDAGPTSLKERAPWSDTPLTERPDTPNTPLTTEAALANAPHAHQGFFALPRVLSDDS
ncbi:Asp-tRNA(Asn)/Glu-tRNA(Gln) amidotransferase GatCAB subunit C [Lujinxingia litoralis]|uniref:Asp-tRNA(Asn)/Glu-tRNA(Gln) amidotransferase GatCAB subunit C n=1 Tax=Lujinxingia litoralis TaxID=2211119 RepID=A0A328CCR2_9DELT|nr:Asp-tRNA(Asn)/Glu-tRNA(Gln) amidotransferase subunit GatC [Lujinxingia litoralis]RAL23977.1 Asp-tRNA(Asn)/Glu-tRNA(Gln) amidotransferase GatCAB subunit C [Lujinxingia litoralis]